MTQNVDGLHQRAGSARVIELHGCIGRVVCLDCGAAHSREAVQRLLEADNMAFADAPARLRPTATRMARGTLDAFAVPAARAAGEC